MKVLTYSGIMFDILEPNIKDVRLEDIGRGLANQARFNGQSRKPISIAQHSIGVLERAINGTMLNEDDDKYMCRVQALFHDAAEAYIGDMVSPIKKHTKINDVNFKEIEEEILSVIFDKYGIEWPMRSIIDICDEEQTQHEMDFCRSNIDEVWGSSEAFERWIGTVIKYI